MDSITTMRSTLQVNTDEGRQRLGWLGPVRMFVIAFIAFGYASTMPRGPGSPEYLRVLGYDPSWYGIAMIFMISGFLALKSLQRHGSAIKFLSSRLFRNLPLVLLFAILVILVIFPIFAVPMDAGGSRLEQHMRYLVKVVSCFDPNELTPGLLDNALYMCIIQGGLWTFRWGLIAFIVTAGLWALGGLRQGRILLLLTLGLTMTYAILVVYYIQNPSPILDLPIVGLRLGWAYMAGMCAYMYRDRLPHTILIPTAAIALAAAQYFLLPWTPFVEISVELGLGYLLFLAITSKATLPRFLNSVPDLSLGLYVFNWPAAQLTLLMLPTLTPLSLFVVSFTLTILISYVSWASLSRPINSRIGRNLFPLTT